MAIELLLNSGVPYRRRGNELIYQTCPECGNNRYNLQVNLSKGFYHCWACDRGGRLRGLSVLAADFGIEALQDSPIFDTVTIPETAESISLSKEGKAYLERRGVSEQDIRTLGVLYDEEDESMYVPYYEGERLVAYNVRTKKGRWEFIGESRELLYYLIYGKTEYVIICEGFFDAAKLMHTGHSVFVLFGKILYERQLVRILQLFNKIVLALDNDEWGKRAALKIVKQLDQTKAETYILRVPEGRKDFGDCTNDEIKRLIIKKFGIFEKLDLRLK